LQSAALASLVMPPATSGPNALICARRGAAQEGFPRMNRLAVLLWAALLVPVIGKGDGVVVFNEIMYHPATNEPALEWVELYNQMAVDVDLSGWRIADGIEFLFPSGTVLRSGGYLVVAIAPDALTAQSGATNVTGPFAGRLSNNGEELELRDLNNRVMDSVKYGVDGEWPAGPDGTGVSLAKKAPLLASRPADNWTVSAQPGGTPGGTNFTAGHRHRSGDGLARDRLRGSRMGLRAVAALRGGGAIARAEGDTPGAGPQHLLFSHDVQRLRRSGDALVDTAADCR